jgi:hypothetical protein
MTPSKAKGPNKNTRPLRRNGLYVVFVSCSPDPSFDPRELTDLPAGVVTELWRDSRTSGGSKKKPPRGNWSLATDGQGQLGPAAGRVRWMNSIQFGLDLIIKRDPSIHPFVNLTFSPVFLGHFMVLRGEGRCIAQVRPCGPTPCEALILCETGRSTSSTRLSICPTATTASTRFLGTKKTHATGMEESQIRRARPLVVAMPAAAQIHAQAGRLPEVGGGTLTRRIYPEVRLTNDWARLAKMEAFRPGSTAALARLGFGPRFLIKQSISTLFDNPLFRQIWYDIPGVFCKYGSSSSFSRRVDEEFVKARTQLKKELGEIGNCKP